MANAAYPIPSIAPVSRVTQILKILKEADLMTEMGKFEDAIYEAGDPLLRLLRLDVRSNDVANLLDHMTSVERWRERTTRWFGLATCFVSHCKSDHFIVKREKGISDFDREAYQKRLLAGFLGLETWLEGLVKSVDSRVNLCKKLLGLEEGTNN